MDVKARVSSGDELLNEKFTIPSIITTPDPIDFNTFTTPGIYYLGSHSNFGADDCNFINYGPIKNWGTLIVSGKGGTTFQIFIEDTNAAIHHRYFHENDNIWSDWITLIDKNTALDKAFPVGFSYLAVDKTTPSFGTWTYEICGFMSDRESGSTIFKNNIRVYVVTRTA